MRMSIILKPSSGLNFSYMKLTKYVSIWTHHHDGYLQNFEMKISPLLAMPLFTVTTLHILKYLGPSGEKHYLSWNWPKMYESRKIHEISSIFKFRFLLIYALWGGIQGIFKCLKGSENLFLATNHISGHSLGVPAMESAQVQNAKKCQNHDLGQKFKFLEYGRKCPEMWYMAGNESLKCFRSVLHPDSISRRTVNGGGHACI